MSSTIGMEKKEDRKGFNCLNTWSKEGCSQAKQNIDKTLVHLLLQQFYLVIWSRKKEVAKEKKFLSGNESLN